MRALLILAALAWLPTLALAQEKTVPLVRQDDDQATTEKVCCKPKVRAQVLPRAAVVPVPRAAVVPVPQTIVQPQATIFQPPPQVVQPPPQVIQPPAITVQPPPITFQPPAQVFQPPAQVLPVPTFQVAMMPVAFVPVRQRLGLFPLFPCRRAHAAAALGVSVY